MRNLSYKKGKLFLENKNLETVAKKYGTPLFVYSKKAFIDSYSEIADAIKGLDNMICFSVKTCSNINIIKILKEQGCGCDIVSGGELYRCLKAGVSPDKIVFAGVGKTAEEIEYALKSEIFMFNCESESEIQMINKIAGKLKKKAKIAVRVNPDVDADTHAKITTGKKENKFGIDINVVPELYNTISKLKNVIPYGVHCHIGSQITNIKPFELAVDKVLNLIDKLSKNGIEIKTINLGGGLGINYQPGSKPINVKQFGQMLKKKLKNRNLKLLLEPGRYIAGNSGTFVVKTVHIKDSGAKKFVITDGAMNDLIRPTLYEAYHHIIPLNEIKSKTKCDIVGPVCESGDFFAKDRMFEDVKQNDFIAVLSAGAYGFSMSSNYNSRPRTAEVLIDKSSDKLIRKRETYEKITELENI
jgi:diaminopimelate decarboxylase